jgi:hypothetical protein
LKTIHSNTEKKSRVSSAWLSPDIPRIPLFDPFLDVAMQNNVTGYEYWFHRRLDYRPLAKT